MSSKSFTALWDDFLKRSSADNVFSVEELSEVFWAWRMINWPEYATFSGHHDFDDKLNDTSLEGFEYREKTAKQLYAQCCKINMSTLNDKDVLNLHLLKEELKTFIDGMPFKGYLLAINYNEGMQCDFEQLTSWMKFETVEDYNKYVSRLKSLPNRIADDIKLLQEGIKCGVVYSAYSMRGVLEQYDALLQTDYEKSIFFQPLLKIPDGIAGELEEMKEEVKQLVKDQIIPAFTKQRIFVENEYIPNCRKDPGITSIPNGKEFYQQCLRFHLSLDMTPEQVHELGRQEVCRIRREMEEVIKKLEYQGEFRDFLNHLRTNQEFFYSSEEDLLNGFRDICDNKIRPRLSKLFKKIPTSKLTIKPAPPSRPHGPAAYYLAGTLDGSRPGVFHVSSHNLQNCPKYEMMTLALHEGEPGHHFQGMYAIETKDAPEFRKHNEDMCYFQCPSRFPMYTAFVEGWGLYSEYLGNELGLFDDDLYSKFGHLSFEMHRACRLVADTGLHAFGWSYKKALMLFMENTALSEVFINNEVTRYLTWPGQACAYKVGQLKIKQLRKKAETTLGDALNVQDLHEIMLNCLQAPLNVIEKLIDNYVQKQKSQ